MTTWNIIAILLCTTLLAFMCVKEWQRVNRSRLILRLLASLIAIACFACLALPLSIKSKLTGNKQKPAILLTPGFSRDSITSFLRRSEKGIPVYSFDHHLHSGIIDYKVQVISTADWELIKEQISTLHVFGNGLDKEELATLSGASINFHPSEITDGISSVSWPQQINAGEQLLLQGHFRNSSPAEVKLVLAGYDVNLDTVSVAANKSADFQLSATPKQLGRAVYSLIALSGKDTLEQEPVPFEIKQAGDLKLLILAASPDFENKFLRSWLAQGGYSLASRTTISKNKSDISFFNTAQVSLASISPALLKNFDVLVADASELSRLGKSEIAAIESQVSQYGMGLIIKSDSVTANSNFYSKPFPVINNNDSSKKSLNIIIPAKSGYATSITAEHPVFIRHQAGTQSLVEDRQSNIIVSSTIFGSGKLIFTTLNNTFTWMLSGDNSNYQAFWSYLLEKATAKTTIEQSWSISPAYPYVNKAVEINYAGSSTGIPQVQVGDNFVHLRQHPGLPFQWQGTYWPEKPGWQPILQENSNTFWWYVYRPDDWKTMAALQQIKTTKDYIASVQQQMKMDAAETDIVEIPINKKYFLIFFFISAGFLWLEKKL